uniref:Septin-type G domain-containing protein n=1 Tax=Strigamia maritima TaxID=126957 RepID=T1J6H9_STRMM
MEGERDYIGFATLPDQIHRKSVKKGFEFTFMVVGDSGLGKSTLINNLFLCDLYRERKVPNAEERVDKTVNISKNSVDIEEQGLKVKVNIVDTPGFGDAINCEESWKTIENYIDEQFQQFFKDESGLHRKNIQDNRVHCCLYFIPPYGHGLRHLDIEFLRRLDHKVNIIPVIAKADTLSPDEVKKLKKRVLEELEASNVQIFKFPECDSDEEEEFKQQEKELKASVPFAVIGSNQVVELNGKKVRGRMYPWGIVEIENPTYSDFNKLRALLLGSHMQDLKDITRDVHYENYRAQHISKVSQNLTKELSKLKGDVNNESFEGVSETDRLLQQKDEEIRRMQDMLNQMQEKLRATGRDKQNKENESPADHKRDTAYFFPAIQEHTIVYSRYQLVKILPYWDWTKLYYKDCLITNPYYEKHKLLLEDCQSCESVESLDHLTNVSQWEISEDYLKNDIPLIILDATESWPIMKHQFSIENITQIYLSHNEIDNFQPCSMSTNLRQRGDNYFKQFLKRIGSRDTKRWFAHWENCDKQASKALRHLYHRPYLLPTMIDTSEPNWVFLSSTYSSRSYKKVQVLSEMMWFAQIRGTNRIKLIPKEPCANLCTRIIDTLYEGEILLFTDFMWRFEYMPGEDDVNIALAGGGLWER